jgi:hypothetical protein
MTQNKQNKPRDEGGLLPVIAANLIANLFELATDPELKTKGGDIRGLGRKYKVSMAVFESGLSSWIERGSGLGPAGKTLAVQLIDNFFDVWKRQPVDADYQTALRTLEEGGRSTMALVKKAVSTKSKPSSKLPKLLLELELVERLEFFDWVVSLQKLKDLRSYNRWEVLKDRIDSKEHVLFALRLPSNERLDYFEMLYGGKPTLLETFEAIVRGEETPQTQALAKKVADAEKNIDDLTRKYKRANARIKKQNERS